jgi:hypothetical protein
MLKPLLASASALFATILLVGGCLAPGAYPRLSDGDEPVITAWVFDHGWHTAIVIRRSDVDRALWPKVDDFPEATFVEVAWGDREFYMARPATPWLAIKAAFLASGTCCTSLVSVDWSPPISRKARPSICVSHAGASMR